MWRIKAGLHGAVATIDFETVKFKQCKISQTKDPNYIYVAARLMDNIDADRTIDTYVYLDIWNADNPSVEQIQLRAIEAISNAFRLTPDQKERAAVQMKAPATKNVSRRNRASSRR